MTVTVAIDGPAASGKGTLARSLAERFHLAYLDTGGLYRAVALKLLDAMDTAGSNEAAPSPVSEQVAPEQAVPEQAAPELIAAELAKALTAQQVQAYLSDGRLRTEVTGALASRIAAQSGVRAALLNFQRNFALFPPADKDGVVLDGRDIGTVVLPEASLKLFVTATAEVRAQRRYEELRAHLGTADYQTCLEDIRARDEQDQSRVHAPLKPAGDAITLDTTDLSAQAALETASSHVKAVIGTH